jgi:hypothetical protein
MSSNIFVTFGSLAGTEQLQTRTRSGANVTRFTRDKFYGENQDIDIPTRREATCLKTGTVNTYTVTLEKAVNDQVCNWQTLYTEFVPSCTQSNMSNPCSGGGTRVKCTFIGTQWMRETQAAATSTVCNWEFYSTTTSSSSVTQSPNCTSCAGSTSDSCLRKSSQLTSSVDTYAFGTYSNYEDYYGVQNSGVSTCNASNEGSKTYQYSTRPSTRCVQVNFETVSNRTSCTSDLRSCANSTISNPRVVCTSYSVCQFGDWTNWSDVDICVSASPTCEQSRDQGTLQRQCQVV